ncbi:DUF3833 family protein [Tepidamorphus gemmatus]|nr:DUF3833 family protein [Tepidamorphus gemmatus]
MTRKGGWWGQSAARKGAGMNMMRPIDGEPFRIETALLGRTRAHGIFQDRFGNVRARFIAETDGYAESQDFILDERFVYDDGRRERRIWRISTIGEDRYVGTADDIVGLAHGRIAPDHIEWRYAIDLPVSGRIWRMRFDDRFFRVGDLVINRARMSKFGVLLGEATIAFARHG